MGGERTVRNLPLSLVLYIYESTTPINVVGARQTRTHQLSSVTLIHVLLQCRYFNLRPSLLPYLLKHPLLFPILFVLSVQQDQANRRARQSRAQPQ